MSLPGTHTDSLLKEGFPRRDPGRIASLPAAGAFTGPERNWAMANPGYGAEAPACIGSGVARVPLRDDYSHDGEAMIEADPDGGVYSICNPDHPAGTVTPRADIEYGLTNKREHAGTARTSSLCARFPRCMAWRAFARALPGPGLPARLRPYGVGVRATRWRRDLRSKRFVWGASGRCGPRRCARLSAPGKKGISFKRHWRRF